MTFRSLACTFALSLAAAAAGAQTMKPGLWEVTTKIGGSAEMDKAMAQMQQQLSSMPPAQRKQMEEMMAKQGVGLAGGSGGGMTAKVCVSKEMAARNQMPVQQQGNCTTTTSDKTASSMKMKFTCTSPPSSGEGQFTFSGDSAYTMKMNVTSTQQGTPRNTTLDSSGKWAAADCGAVKPMAVPPAK
jgi:hypothetical protein